MNRIALAFVFLLGSFWNSQANDNYKALTKNFVNQKASIESMSVLTFGPEGILFIGDSKAGKVFALDLGDRQVNESKEPFELNDVEALLGNLLGATKNGVIIHDMAVNPISQNIYLAVSRSDATALDFWKQPNDISYATILLKISPSGGISEVSLDPISHSMAEVSNVIAPGSESWRKSDKRTEAITDIAYDDGQLYITGLSNEAFASALRVMAFPFGPAMQNTTIEVWHVAHGKSETESPIRTLLPYEIAGEKMILASYTCTPFVSIPVGDLKAGAHIKSKTLAEFGYGNMPIDIIKYTKEGKEYLLMSNTAKALIRINPENIPRQEKGLTEPLQEGEYAVGLAHDVMSMVGITQIDNLNEDHVLLLQRMPNGLLNLRTYPSKWL